MFQDVTFDPFFGGHLHNHPKRVTWTHHPKKVTLAELPGHLFLPPSWLKPTWIFDCLGFQSKISKQKSTTATKLPLNSSAIKILHPPPPICLWLKLTFKKHTLLNFTIEGRTLDWWELHKPVGLPSMQFSQTLLTAYHLDRIQLRFFVRLGVFSVGGEISRIYNLQLFLP